MSATAVATAVREWPTIFTGESVRAILAGTKTQTRRLMVPQPPDFVQHTPDPNPQRHPAPYIDCYCSERKTPANPRGMSTTWCWWTRDNRPSDFAGRCRYGVPGDRLWVREEWQAYQPGTNDLQDPALHANGFIYSLGYRATDEDRAREHRTSAWPGPWRRALFMPRWASRLTLEITDVRVQRLQEISEEDASAEGVVPLEHLGADQPILDTVRGRTQGSHPHVLAYAVAWDTLNDERAPWTSNPYVWAITFRRVA